MSWKACICSVWLLAMTACGAAAISGDDPETDSAALVPDASTVLPPMAAPLVSGAGGSAGAAGALALPAADGGMPMPMPSVPEPMPPGPLMEPAPAAPPPLTVSFDPPGGGFAQPIALSLQPADPAAEVHYTLDGSIPSISSALATRAFMIETTTLVRAVVVRDGQLGLITNQAYFRIDAGARAFRSNLPVIVIDTQSAPLPGPFSTEHVPALIGVFEPSDGTTQLEHSAAATSRIGIKVRGRSTRYQEKPSYTLELRGVNDEDAPAPLLGMPAEGDWVLYAPFTYDRSLMHNVIGYELSRRIGRYAPRTSYCEVFLTSGASGVTQASYVGVYVLTERISRGKSRVPVEKLEPEDVAEPAITGGYIVQANDPDQGDQTFIAAGKQFLFVHPKQEDVLPVQTQYIAGYMDTALRAASAADGRDPTTGQHYSALLDVAAFIDHHILNVLIKNPDAFALSSYFHKDRGGPLVAGPLWDLDLGMGADDPWGQRSIDPTQWTPGNESVFSRSFWGPLFAHAEFESAYWQRWNELLAGPFAVDELQSMVSDFERQLTEAELRNRARWPASAPRNDSFVAEADALRAWFAARVSWISANVGTLPLR